MSGVLNHPFTLTVNPDTGHTTSTVSPNAQQVSYNGLQTPESSLGSELVSSLGLSGMSYKEKYGTTSPYVSVGSSGSKAQVEYPYAMISTMYGADAKSAYQEALSNTAVERRMEDLKRSGINPVLAAQGEGADSVKSVGSVSFGQSGSAGAGSGSDFDYSGGSGYKGLTATARNIINNKSFSSTVGALASGGAMLLGAKAGAAAAVYTAVKGAIDIGKSIFR